MKKFSLSKLFLAILLVAVAITAVAVPAISVYKYNVNAEEFLDDGYMLLATNEKDSESINTQYYFTAGEKYRRTYDDNVTFNDINGEKVKAETQNFIHYNSGSMNGLTDSVILDTDNLDNENQVSYYSIPEQTVLEKSGKRYIVNNAGANINFSNFIWKISNDRYMVVSDKIELCVSDKSEQSFEGFVELRYIDEGIAHIVTHEGTYSTVSSDAYLLLENGIRVYIGSKNVSTDENIIMNMSQMIVGSEDNIEVIPDEDYTIEQDKQPRIVVNATDGETGANGEEGDSGENGENGEPGAKGNKGGGGNFGTDAPNANLLFNPEVMPLFSDLTIDPSSIGFDAVVNFDENTCNVTDAWVSVIDKNTGNEVWRKNIASSPGLLPTIPFECDTLSSDTDYIMNITGVYSTIENPLVKLTQVFTQQPFHTESLGLSLSKKVATSSSLTLNLNKESDSEVKFVRVRFFDENMEFLENGYGIPTDEYNYPLVGEERVFDITDLPVGESVELNMEGLTSNTYYYAQIQVMSVEDGGSVVPTTTYAKQKYKTLKADPHVDAPTARVEETIKSFILVPGFVQDIDNGIVSYRYEIFEQANLADNTPVYSVDMNSLGNITVPIGDVTNPNVLHRNVEYVAQIVAVFDNNETVKDVRSDLSDIFFAGTSTWPTFRVEINDLEGYKTASTFEGRVIIRDEKGSIPENAKITVKYKTSLPESIAEGKDTSREFTIINNVSFADFAKGEDYEYSYPISCKSLKADQDYTLTAYTTSIINGNIVSGSEDAPIAIGNQQLHTGKYSPIYVSVVEKTGTQYLNNWFAVALKIAPSDLDRETDLRKKPSIVSGLADKETGIGDLTGRSMTFLKLELHAEDKANPGTPASGILSTAIVYDSNKHNFPENRYGYLYTFDTDFYNKAYCNLLTDEKNVNNEEFNFVLTDQLFYDEVTNSNPIWDAGESKYYIKLSAYDYTYGISFDPNNHVNGATNEIPIGTEVAFANNEKDAWIEVNAHYAIPEIPQNYPYCLNTLTLADAKAKLDDNAIRYNYQINYDDAEPTPNVTGVTTNHYSNIIDTVSETPAFPGNETKEKLLAMWENEGIIDGTTVGVEYRGPEKLAMFCSASYDSVEYTVYKGDIQDFYDGDETNDPVKITDSGWLNYDYANEDGKNILPDYTIFFNVEDPTTHQELHRGEKFFVITRLRLKGNETSERSEATGTPYYYPDTFYELGILPNAPEKDYIDGLVEAGTQVPKTDIHTFVIFDEYEINRELPNVISLPYNATTNGTTENSDIIYIRANDPDGALDTDEEGNIIVYQPVIVADAETGEPIVSYVEVDPLDPESEKIMNLAQFDVTGGVTHVPGVINEAGDPIPDTDGFMLVSGVMNKIDNLYVRYKLKDSATQFTNIQLTSEENIETARTVEFSKILVADKAGGGEDGWYGVDVEAGAPFKYAFQNNKTIQIEFWYKAHNDLSTDAKVDLLGVDVIFDKYVYEGLTSYEYNLKYTDALTTDPDAAHTAIDAFVKSAGYAEEKFDTIAVVVESDPDLNTDTTDVKDIRAYTYVDNKWTSVEDNTRLIVEKTKSILVNPRDGGEYSYEVEDVTHYIQKGLISIEGINIAEIIKGSQEVKITLRAYYDSGEYGIKYVDSSLENIDSNYYLLENADGEGVGSHGEVYPTTYYQTNKLEGLDMSKTTTSIFDIDTHLFKRNQLTYDFNDYAVVITDADPDKTPQRIAMRSQGLVNTHVKNVKSDSTSITTTMNYILPTVDILDVKAGYTTALISFKVHDCETVLINNNLTIKCIKDGDDPSIAENWTTVEVPYNKGQNDGNDRIWYDQLVKNLKNEAGKLTKYNFQILGYVNDGTVNGTETVIYDKGQFTIAKYNHYPNDDIVNVETYNPSTNIHEDVGLTRDSKRLYYVLHMKEIIKSDIDANLSRVEVSAYKFADCVINDGIISGVNPGAIPVAYTTISCDELKSSMGTSEVGNITYTSYLDWKPLADETHGIGVNDNFQYCLMTRFVYKTDTETSQLDNPAFIKVNYETLSNWKTYFGSTYLTTIGKKKAYFDGNKLKHQITFTVAGRDVNRLMPNGSANQITYYIELYKVTMTGSTQNLTLVGNPISVTSTIDSNGRIGAKAITFDNLEASSRYLCKAYYAVDYENIDYKVISAYYPNPVTNTGYRTNLATNNRSGIYCKTSDIVTTESGDSIMLSTVKLSPASKTATVIGSNLNLVGKVEYIIKNAKTGEQIAHQIFTNDSSASLAAHFIPDETTNNVYYLDVAEMKDPSAQYVINFYIYRASSDKNYEESFEATWPEEVE